MTDRIKRIFTSLRVDRKNAIRVVLATRYNMSVDSVKNMWIYGGKIPAKYKKEVLEILENELKNQIDEDKKILAK
jgi:hypothetical protein